MSRDTLWHVDALPTSLPRVSHILIPISSWEKYPVASRQLRRKIEVEIFSNKSSSLFQCAAMLKMTSQADRIGMPTGQASGSGVLNASRNSRKFSAGIFATSWKARNTSEVNPDPCFVIFNSVFQFLGFFYFAVEYS